MEERQRCVPARSGGEGASARLGKLSGMRRDANDTLGNGSVDACTQQASTDSTAWWGSSAASRLPLSLEV